MGEEDTVTALCHLPDELLEQVLSHLPARQITIACAVVFGVRARGSPHHRESAILLRLERVAPPPPPLCEGESPIDLACFLDALVDRRRATIAAGVSHGVCLRPGDQRPYSWGGKDNGSSPYCQLYHLGHGIDEGQCVRAPNRMVGLDLLGVPLVECAAGRHHTVLMTNDGEVWTCGEWPMGRLGHGRREHTSVARPVEALAEAAVRATQVSCGSSHTLVLSDRGEVWILGEDVGAHGAGGFGSFDCPLPRCVLGCVHAAPLPHPAHGPALSRPIRICQLSAGGGHSLAVAISGELFAWG